MDDPPNTTDYDSTTQSSNVTEMFTNATDADDNPGDDYDDYSDAETARMVHVIGRPILIVLGTIGNCLAFYVMRKGSLKNVSTCFYMAILALADTGYLWSGAFVWWVAYLTHWRVNPEVWGDCKLDYFLYYFCAHYSSALLVIMSLEKFVALYFPIKAKQICTVRTAKIVCLVSALIFAAFDSQFFFIIDAHTDEDGYDSCKYSNENYELIFNRIDSTLYSFGPFAIMIIANSAIIYKFMKAKLKQNKQVGIATTQATNQTLSKKATKGTLMLVTVSFGFVILTGPISVAYAITRTPHSMVDAVTVILDCLNHSINAVLYCASGSRFRAELLKTIRLRRNVEGSVIPSTTGNNHTSTASPM